MSEKLRVAPSMIRVTGLGLPSAFRMTNVWARHDPAEPGPPLPPAARGGAEDGVSLVPFVVARFPGPVEVFRDAAHDVELVVRAEGEQVGHPVGEREQGGDGADVPDLLISEAGVSEALQIVLVDLGGADSELD